MTGRDNVTIHPSAIVDPKAELDHGVSIGAFALVGPKVRLGRDVKVREYAIVTGRTTVGARSEIHSFATVGVRPQDLKFHGEDSEAILGEDNQIREYVNISLGTENGGGKTVIGSRNLIMVYCHIAHDCIIGNGCIFAASANLAGHVTVLDRALLGGMCGVHQFCRVGEHSMVAGGSMVVHDVPPYCLVQGDRAKIAGLNMVGLRRGGYTPEALAAIKSMYKHLYRENLTTEDAIARIETDVAPVAEREVFLRFLRAAQRGVCR